MKRLFFAILILFVGYNVKASNNRSKFDVKSQPQSSISTGIGVIQPAREYIYDYYPSPYPQNQTYDLYMRQRVTTPIMNITYSYRFSRCFSISAIAAYVTAGGRYYDLYDDSYLFTERLHSFVVMPSAKFHWFTSKSNFTTLYSSFGLGWMMNVEVNSNGVEGCQEMTNRGAVQFNYFGLSIGRRLYGVVELGVGAMGALNVGVGYRF